MRIGRLCKAFASRLTKTWLPQFKPLVYNEEMNVELERLRKLSVSDKLRIVEELWDDIGRSDEPIVLPDWHKQEALRRGAELQADPGLAITRAELWKRVDESDG